MRLQDRMDIAESYSIYARAIDEKRYDLLPRVFLPDAALLYEVGPHEFSCTGAEASTNFSNFLTLCYWTNHLIAAPMIDFNFGGPNEAFATARVTATHLQKDTSGKLNRWILRGSYHDEFINRNQAWSIKRRICICTDSEGVFLDTGVAKFEEMSWGDPDLISPRPEVAG